MPSPIAHIASGCFAGRKMGLNIVLCLFVSILPDFDFLPGMFFNDPGGWHGSFSHSITACIVLACAVYCFCRFVAKRPDALKISVLTATVYGMHILMDFFTDGRGIMLLWPLKKRFVSPVSLFTGLKWSEPLNSVGHFWTVLNEGAFVAGMLMVFYAIRMRKIRQVA